MKVYKIVRKSADRLLSFGVAGAAVVEYQPGIPARPPKFLEAQGYGLTAYDDLDSAFAMLALADLSWELWEAEAEGVSKTLPPFLDPVHLGEGKIEFSKGAWPPHTIMAASLKLVRRIGYSRLAIFVPVDSAYRGLGRNKEITFSPSGITFGQIFGYESGSIALKANPSACCVLKGVGYGVLVGPAKGLVPGEAMTRAFRTLGIIAK